MQLQLYTNIAINNCSVLLIVENVSVFGWSAHSKTIRVKVEMKYGTTIQNGCCTKQNLLIGLQQQNKLNIKIISQDTHTHTLGDTT